MAPPDRAGSHVDLDPPSRRVGSRSDSDAFLAWVVSPLLAMRFSGPTATAQALVLSLTAGMVWQLVLVLIVVRREQGPWVIPQTLLVDTFTEALPSRWYRSSLIGIAVHSSQTIFFTAVALALVLR